MWNLSRKGWMRVIFFNLYTISVIHCVPKRILILSKQDVCFGIGVSGGGQPHLAMAGCSGYSPVLCTQEFMLLRGSYTQKRTVKLLKKKKAASAQRQVVPVSLPNLGVWMHVQTAWHAEMKLLGRAGCDVVEEKAGWKLFLRNVRQRQGAGGCPGAFEWLPAAWWFRCSSPHTSGLCGA